MSALLYSLSKPTRENRRLLNLCQYTGCQYLTWYCHRFLTVIFACFWNCCGFLCTQLPACTSIPISRKKILTVTHPLDHYFVSKEKGSSYGRPPFCADIRSYFVSPLWRITTPSRYSLPFFSGGYTNRELPTADRYPVSGHKPAVSWDSKDFICSFLLISG